MNTTEDKIAAEIWAVLDKVLRPIEAQQPGDVTLLEVAEHYGISEEAARIKLNKIVETGALRRVTVGQHRNGREQVVYRVVSVETKSGQ